MKHEPTKIAKLVAYLKHPETWFQLIAVLVVIIITALDVTGREVDSSQAVIFVLGLLVTGQLTVGFSSMNHADNLEKISQQQFEKIANLIKHSKRQVFRTRGQEVAWGDYFHGTQNLDALGLSLAGLCLPHLAQLVAMKNAGGHIRILVANPRNENLSDLIAARSLEFCGNTHAQISNVDNVLNQLKQYVGTTSNGGSLKVRTYNLIPTFAYIGTDTDKQNGQLHIELYLTQVGLNHNPLFTLYADEDAPWYSQFKGQYEIFWDQGNDPFEENTDETGH